MQPTCTIKQLTCNHTLFFQPFQTGLKPVEKVDQSNQLEKVFANRTEKPQPTRNG